MIQVRCYHTLAEAEYLREGVNALNLSCANPCPFSSFEFYENFLANDEYHPRGEGARPWFLAGFRDDLLIGYLVLKQVRHWSLGWPSSKLGFLVDHSTDRPHLVARSENLAALSRTFYEYLLSRGREWSMLEFQQQDASSGLFPPPPCVAEAGYLIRDWVSLENASIALPWLDLRAYMAALSKKHRSNLKRQLRRLHAAGQLEFLSSSDPAALPALFELCRSIEPFSWKASAKATISRDPQRVEYFNGLLGARQPMQISIQILLLDQVPISAMVNGMFGNKLYALHIVYDDRAAALGPGSAILLMGIREALLHNCSTYNLLSGFGYYKTRWLAQMTPARTGQIYRFGSAPYCRRLIGDTLRKSRRPRDEGPVRYNPSRRNSESPTALTTAHRSRAVGTADSAHIGSLIKKARDGHCEFLGAAEWAQIMSLSNAL